MPKIELSDRYLRNLELPVNGRIEISDAKRVGLRFRLSPGGKAVWLYEKRIKGGKKRKHTLGNWPTFSLAQARSLALELEAEASRGIDRVAIAEAERAENERLAAQRLTVRDTLNTYYELHLKNLRRGEERRHQIEAALVDRLDQPVEDLRVGHLQAAIDEKQLDGKPTFANRIRAALAAFAKWLWRRGYHPENLGQRLAPPAKEFPRERVLSIVEIRKIYAATYELGTLWGPLVRLLMLTAQRRNKIVTLRWEEVDFEKAQIIKPGLMTKNGKPHISHLSGPALDELNSLVRAKEGFIFSTVPGRPVSGISRMKRRLDRLIEGEVVDWRLHDFRTAFATSLAEDGFPENVVDRVLNHAASGSAPSAVARVYNQAELLPQRARALDHWADLIKSKEHRIYRIA